MGYVTGYPIQKQGYHWTGISLSISPTGDIPAFVYEISPHWRHIWTWSLFFCPNFFAPKSAQNLSRRGPPNPPTIGTYLYIYVRTYNFVRTYIMFISEQVCVYKKKWKDVFSTWHVKRCKLNENAEKMMWKLTWSSFLTRGLKINQSHPSYSLPPL